jgi:hypothetical protein
MWLKNLLTDRCGMIISPTLVEVVPESHRKLKFIKRQHYITKIWCPFVSTWSEVLGKLYNYEQYQTKKVNYYTYLKVYEKIITNSQENQG